MNSSIEENKNINYCNKAEVIPLTFYAKGESNGSSIYHNLPYDYRNAYQDKSINILNRNKYSINTNEYRNKILQKNLSASTINELNIKGNNYLDPFYNYKNENHEKENSMIFGNITLDKTREFLKETKGMKSIEKGVEISKENFIKLKNEMPKIINRSRSTENIKSLGYNGYDQYPKRSKLLRDNILYFDANKMDSKSEVNKEMLFNMSVSGNSKNVPKWMNIVSQKRLAELSKNIKQTSSIEKETMGKKTLSVFSRFNSWVTIEPDGVRTNPLESNKNTNPDKYKLIRPYWLTTKYWNQKYKDNMRFNKVNEDKFVSRPYNKSIKEKYARKMELVDKRLVGNGSYFNKRNDRSVFNIGDYRHNVSFKNECKEYQKFIDDKPRNFFMNQ